MKHMRLLVLLSVILSVIPACRKRYEPTFDKISPSYRAEQHHIELSAKALTASESYALFGTDLPSQGYQPFHAHFHNKSTDTYVLDWQHIAVPLTSDFVIQDYTDWPTWWITFTTGLLAGIYCFQLIPLVILPSAYYMMHYNQDMDKMLEHYNMKHHEPIEILPHAHVDRVFFVCGWQPGLTFDIGLVNKTNGNYIKFVVTP